MKKILALSLVICIVFGLVACSGKKDDSAENATTLTATPTTPTESTAPTTEPTNTPVLHTFDESIQYNYFDILVRYGKSVDSKESLDIPVYSEDVLLFSPDNRFHLTRDTSANLISSMPVFNVDSYYIFNVLRRFPNELRVRPDCSSYAVYDTDTGYRLYLFFVPRYNGGVLTGYPIVINKNKELLSYSHFESIQIGDPIEKVEAIDDVTTLYKKQLAKLDFIDSEYYERLTKSGNPVVSIHYLRDGILRIEYKMPEKPNLIVSNITYYDSSYTAYTIKTADGEMTNHRIYDIDLPCI